MWTHTPVGILEGRRLEPAKPFVFHGGSVCKLECCVSVIPVSKGWELETIEKPGMTIKTLRRVPDKWDERWMRLAWEVASWASCLRAKAGAVAVTQDNRPLSLAYNGAPQGMPSCVELGACITEGEPSHCVNSLHVEDNLILFAPRDTLVGARVYITMTPCVRCTNKLIQAQVGELVYDMDYANGTSKSLERFKSAGVLVRRVHI